MKPKYKAILNLLKAEKPNWTIAQIARKFGWTDSLAILVTRYLICHSALTAKPDVYGRYKVL